MNKLIIILTNINNPKLKISNELINLLNNINTLSTESEILLNKFINSLNNTNNNNLSLESKQILLEFFKSLVPNDIYKSIPSTISTIPSTISTIPSTISTIPSTISTIPSTISTIPRIKKIELFSNDNINIILNYINKLKEDIDITIKLLTIPSIIPSIIPSLNPSLNTSIIPYTNQSIIPSIIPSTNQSIIPSIIPSTNQWQYFNNSYCSQGEYIYDQFFSKNTTTIDDILNIVINNPSCISVYIYDGPEITANNWLASFIGEPSTISLMYNRYGSMVRYDPNNRYIYNHIQRCINAGVYIPQNYASIINK
jgi:hypothetical protein